MVDAKIRIDRILVSLDRYADFQRTYGVSEERIAHNWEPTYRYLADAFDEINQVDDPESVQIDRLANSVQRITMAKPERSNALSADITAELILALDRAERDDSVAAVVLTGEERAFSAGVDIPAIKDDINMLAKIALLLSRAYWFSKLLIAAINGSAWDMGLALATAADLRLAVPRAQLRGVHPTVHSTESTVLYSFLSTMASPGAASQLCWQRRLSAEDGKLMGVVHLVEPDIDAVLDTARGLAVEWADSASVEQVRNRKRSLRSLTASPISQVLAWMGGTAMPAVGDNTWRYSWSASFSEEGLELPQEITRKARDAIQESAGVTERDLLLIQWLAEGKRMPEIAKGLDIPLNSARVRFVRLMHYLDYVGVEQSLDSAYLPGHTYRPEQAVRWP